MTDKANPTPRAEEAAESAAKVASGSETSAIQDFVAGLLPKVASRESSSNASQDSGNTGRDGVNNAPKENASGSNDRSQNGLDKSRSTDKGDITDKKLQPQDFQIVGDDQKNTIALRTGDTLVRAGGIEVLSMKGGGTVLVKPDGSYEVTGGTVKHDAKSGETTVDFGNGKSATIRGGKIETVTDGKTTAWMVSMANKLENRHVDEWPSGKALPESVRPDDSKKHSEGPNNLQDAAKPNDSKRYFEGNDKLPGAGKPEDLKKQQNNLPEQSIQPGDLKKYLQEHHPDVAPKKFEK